MTYKLSKFREEVTSIHVYDKDGQFVKAIPLDEANTDYQEYLAWTKASPNNVAEEAD